MNSGRFHQAFAIWLLQRLAPGKNQDVLIGDLLEHLSNRRSALWFWREVLTLIAFGFADGVKKHWLDVVFALGGTALYSSSLKAMWRTPAFEYLFGYSIGWPWLISAACQFTLLATFGSVEIGIILIFVRLLNRSFRWTQLSAVLTSFTILIAGDLISQWFNQLPTHSLRYAAAQLPFFVALLIPMWKTRQTPVL